LDGRYAFLSASTSNTDDYVTGSTFTDGILEFTRQSGSTFNVDLDGRYLTGFTETPHTAALIFSPTGNTTGIIKSGRTEAYYGDIGGSAIDFSRSNSLSSVYGATGFNSFAVGFNVEASGSYSTVFGLSNDATGDYSSAFGHSVSSDSYAEFNVGSYSTLPTPNSATSWDAADRIFNVGIGATGGNRLDGLTVYKLGNVIAPNLTTALITSGDVKTLITKEYLTGHTSGFTNGVSTDDYVTGSTFTTTNGNLEFTRLSGGTFDVNLDGRYLNVTASTANSNDYLTGHTFNTTTGLFESTLQSGGTVSVNLDGRYAYSSGHTHTISEITDYVPTDDYVTGSTFTTNNGNLEFTRVSGGTFNVNLDGRYLNVTASTANSNDYVTGHTFNTTNGLFESTTQSGTTFNVDLDGRYAYLSATTVGTDDYVSGATFTTNNGILEFTRVSGDTFNVNLDGRYLNVTASTANSNDYLTGGTFNISTGDLDLTLQSGSTVTINLDNRYSLTGHTHDEYSLTGHTHTISEITDYVPTDDYVTGHTFNTTNGLFESTTQSGTTFNVNLDGRYLNVTASTTNTDDYLTGGTFNIGTGDLDLNLQSGS
jgi:hypothetical protein